VLFDVGGTLVHEASPGRAVTDLVARTRDGAVADLETLAHTYRLGAVTDTAVMGEEQVRRLLAPSGLDALLEVVVTSADVGVAKPDPRSLRCAMARLGLDPATVLYVGDRDLDAAAAAAAGAAFAPVGDGSPGRAVIRWLRANEGAFAAARALLGVPDRTAEEDARHLHDRLTKPPRSLGDLETLGARLAGIAGRAPPPLPFPAAVAVFAGDHGVVASGVTPWPQAVTAQMVVNFSRGGAAVNVLARAAGASVTVVDVGVAGPVPPAPGLIDRRVRPGTANLADGPAMTVDDARAAMDVGAEVAADLVAGGARALVTGDMGIGNTTPAAALVAAFTGLPAWRVTGRGTGIDDATLAIKIAVIDRALARGRPDEGPIEVAARLGGLEHAALCGFVVGGAAARVPVLIDGVIALSAVLTAAALAPRVVPFCIAGHRSTEPGADAALAHLGLTPLLQLRMRLGEGSGACLALPLVRAAALVLREMATFDEAGIGR